MTSAANQHESSNLNKYTTTNPVYRWHIGTFHDRIAALVKSQHPASILDVGCGEGFLSAHLHESMPDVSFTGIDASAGAIDFARDEFGNVGLFEVGDIFNLRFADNSIDVVICSEVLEHLEDPGSALKELMRVARRAVVLSVPLEPYFKFFNDVARALRISPDPEHVQFWNHARWQAFVLSYSPDAAFGTVHYYQTAICPIDGGSATE